ncbi:flavin-containing monooxygenase [Rhodococcus erythropolis]|uniref:flavin-containing monooxygenase n=1 Tax=Rhodococcus erythropolis TaxID=1833 RepID=UPI0037A2611A
MTVQHHERREAVIIGAGFGGMYALHRLRDDLGLDVVVIERGSDVGGTWFWNRYPGARCDAESIFYSYSFDEDLQNSWTWTEKYATQPEILSYAQHVADRYDLRRSIRFETEVESAHFDEENDEWIVDTSTGTVASKYLITAVGCLSASRIPDVAGLDHFSGEVHHTGHWPHEGVELSGKRVAMIGTGSSGIQLLPAIAAECAEVTVFQRTPNFSVPARNRRLGPDELQRIRAVYPQLREMARFSGGGQVSAPPIGSALGDPAVVRAEMDRRWNEGGPGFVGAFSDLMVDEQANQVAADYVREQITKTVTDPVTADLLSPKNYPIGSKRICVDTDYYATFNRDNVALVDVSKTPITRITSDGIEVDGIVNEVDAIIFATGFDAMTGPFARMDIRGREGVRLADSWAAGPRTYLGVSVAKFPNMFMITGPGSPSVLSNMMASIEQHVDWIADYLTFMRQVGITRTEPSLEAQNDWVQEVNDVAAKTLYVKGKSWYLGANVPGKPRVFMPYAGGVGTYRQHCDLVKAKRYPGFVHTASPVAPKTSSTQFTIDETPRAAEAIPAGA